MPEITSELEKARKHLLDLTTRNRLLSIPQSQRSKSVKVTDELSEEIMRMLVMERRSFTFLPVDEEPVDAESTAALEDHATGRDGESDFDTAHLGQPDDLDDDDGVLDERGGAARHKDTCLQTLMKSEALQSRLVGISNDARTAIEEQGVNTLYLALGQLKWREAKASAIDRFAPLLLIPVELKRRSAQSKFKLAALDQDLSDNLSLTEKLKEFGVKAPVFEGGDDFSISDYFGAYAESISAKEDWAVLPDAIVLSFFSFAKFLMFRDLHPENWPGEHALERHALIDGLMGEGFPRGDDPLPDVQPLDDLVSVENLSHVVDADSSQALAIEEVRRGQNLVIQGPPGTGKSQTITNLIATAVLDGKKVLFVAEKLAALEVVSRRLAETGLAPIALELHSHRANKRAVLEELKRTLDLGSPRSQMCQRILVQLRTYREQLNGHALLLNERRKPCGLTAIDIMGHITRLQTGILDTEGVPSLEHPEDWTPEEMEERRLLLTDIQARIETLGTPSEHPWYGVQNTKLDKFDTDEIVAEAAQEVDALLSLRESAAALAEALCLATPETLASTGYYIDLGRIVASAPDLDATTIADSAWISSLEELRNLAESGKRFSVAKVKSGDRFIESAWDTDLSRVRMRLAAHGKSLFRFLNGSYRNAMAEFRAVLREPKPPKDLQERLEWLDTLASAKSELENLQKNEPVGRRCFGDLWQGENSEWKKLHALVRWVEKVFAKGHGEDLMVMISRIPDRERCGKLAGDLEPQQKEFGESVGQLCGRLELDTHRAFGVDNTELALLDDLQERLGAWSKKKESLSKWAAHQMRAERARDLGLRDLVNSLEQGTVAGEDAERAFLYAYYRQLYRALLAESPELNEFDGESHGRLVQVFRDADRERIRMARYEVLETHHDTLPAKAGAAGALGILLGEMKRKRGHMPIRKLIAKTGPAIQAIKPVFMMSPLSVAQFLSPGAVEFDLVVFDEASQVEPVDALGAIARGQQLVVVGDDKQLPPTRFFAKLGAIEEEDDDYDDGEAKAGDIESVLGLAEAKGLPGKMLRWHYRSRHDSLIAVSNSEFYEHRLFIVPSPIRENERLGLKLHKTDGGVFDRGKSKTNRIEARAVAKAVIEHALSRPGESLGVAAFSVSQRDAIIDELELLRRNHPETEEFFVLHPYEPFFVKNLENVQGDERDVIFISVGYAPDENGFFGMNFGPINRDGGERRLNVLISRAKNRCEVFSSIVADQIDVGRSNKRGVVALKCFLKYAETGLLGTPDDNTGREIESPFESAVKTALEQHGYVLRPQIGTAGFFIDLAVVDPKNPGRYLLGIECDGATYHSARSARERDRQRQAVLEDHGWKIHRIWSTDWFQRPKEELKKTIHAIEEARMMNPAMDRPKGVADSETGFAVERDEPALEEQEEPASYDSYEEARFSVPAHVEIHSMPIEGLRDIVEQIVRIESPIHLNEVITRVRMLWGLGRAGNRIQHAVAEAARSLVGSGRAEQEGGFFLHSESQLKVRDRSDVNSPSLRKPDYLPPTEIDAAILDLAERNHGLVETEVAKTVSDALGFSALSQKLRARIEPRIAHLVESGKMERTAQGYVRPTS